MVDIEKNAIHKHCDEWFFAECFWEERAKSLESYEMVHELTSKLDYIGKTKEYYCLPLPTFR